MSLPIQVQSQLYHFKSRILALVATQVFSVVMVSQLFGISRTPTVSLGVTYAVVCTYGYDDGRIAPTRCALIAAGLDGRCRLRRTRRTPPAAARSARSVLAAGLRPVSTADPGAFPRARTTPPAGIRPCGDASPPTSAPGMRPCPLRLCLV